jgi:hypothetical protein
MDGWPHGKLVFLFEHVADMQHPHPLDVDYHTTPVTAPTIPNKIRYLAIISAHGLTSIIDFGGDAMDQDLIALMKLKEAKRRRRTRRVTASRPLNEAMMPRIKMIVSSWHRDELGNRARIIKAWD